MKAVEAKWEGDSFHKKLSNEQRMTHSSNMKR